MDIELNIWLPGPIKAAALVDDEHGQVEPVTGSQVADDPGADQVARMQEELNSMRIELDRRFKLIEDLAEKMSDSYKQMVLAYKGQIARLAVEIARKIIGKKAQAGDYDIEAIVQQALEKVPVARSLTVRVSQKDLATCKGIQQERPDTAWADLTFVQDPALGPAECVIESPKGWIKCLIDEQLAKVQQALEAAQ